MPQSAVEPPLKLLPCIPVPQMTLPARFISKTAHFVAVLTVIFDLVRLRYARLPIIEYYSLVLLPTTASSMHTFNFFTYGFE